MLHTGHQDDQDSTPGNFWSRGNIVFIGFLAIAGFYLTTEHRAHLFGALPILFLLACPLLHVFMHGRHGGHGSGTRPPTDKSDGNPPSPPAGGGHHH